MTNQEIKIDSLSQLDPEVKDYEEKLFEEAKKRADVILRKERREIKRLKGLYEDSLLKGNKEQFVYALGKLRKIYKQSTDKAVLDYCYETSRKALFKIIEDAKNDTKDDI
ncbi:hypothetical protein KNT81_gp197 [Proteus phage phiP4-3]|uniref:Uncharacterized protein n=1 Tax=Proteus phage phiP4-3 TaxID=2065203 RepID=A0A2I6PFT8_9CAUD|nr:hypothetical protein KNT81_gp197 [Proteus phage phiP4-3]AUM58574.1 hypothetical protein phiP43_216 [Proteus phage phiP4-3]AZV01186.1 hypothetical protein vBSdyM006_049 [Shigella phage vB_SdyM_006]